MKKMIALALSVLAAITLFAGCASTRDSVVSGKEQTIPTISSIEVNPGAEIPPTQGEATEILLPSGPEEISVTEPEQDVTAPKEVVEKAGFDFTFPPEMAGCVEYAFSTSSSILVHYSSDEFDGYVDFVKFSDENGAYDTIRGDYYYYDLETVTVNGVEMNILSSVDEDDGHKEKIIAYWKINEWCYEMETRFAPDCDFDAVLEFLVSVSLNQK